MAEGGAPAGGPAAGPTTGVTTYASIAPAVPGGRGMPKPTRKRKPKKPKK